ncbi:MAG: UDP-N-acetylmuramate--L-alanine ligase [Sphingobacteriales bacterium]|nr:UDP-N-acetylmuramate--L-alanine ligase [Sphingobacteriales bacterium]
MAPFLEKLHAGNAEGYAVYFLGIGGIGMSALARYFNSRKVKVSGYDKTPTALTLQLEDEGMQIHYEDDINMIETDAVLVVYTPAIPAGHKEFNFFKDEGYAVMKRSEVLGIITVDAFNICVAGTHGKTTTSTMIAHMLRHSGYGCNALLGGIASNYDTNFWASEKNVYVVEADEYDRSFLQLNPDIAIVTAMDPDHLDIYGTAARFRDAFADFSGKVRREGTLYYKYQLEGSEVLKAPNLRTYAVNKVQADCNIYDIDVINGAYTFSWKTDWKTINNLKLNMGGMHNVENVSAAIAVGVQLGLSDDSIRDAVASFKGVRRRFEYVLHRKDLVMIDDYAHHPAELTALISGTKLLFPFRKCTIVFQPHLYSRTRDFALGFANALSAADEVILLPIYPARELPIAGVESDMIAKMMDQQKVSICSKDELMQKLSVSRQKGGLSLLVTAGAGDIDLLIQPIRKMLTEIN